MNDESLTTPLLSPTCATERATPLDYLESFLQASVAPLKPEPVEDAKLGAGAPRALHALCLWVGLLVCVLRGFDSQLALWRLLSVQGLWHYPRFALSEQAVYKRLAQAGSGAMRVIFAQVRDLLAERLAPWAAHEVAPFASAVLALDETTLDQVARR